MKKLHRIRLVFKECVLRFGVLKMIRSPRDSVVIPLLIRLIAGSWEFSRHVWNISQKPCFVSTFSSNSYAKLIVVGYFRIDFLNKPAYYRSFNKIQTLQKLTNIKSCCVNEPPCAQTKPIWVIISMHGEFSYSFVCRVHTCVFYLELATLLCSNYFLVFVANLLYVHCRIQFTHTVNARIS